MQAVHYNPQLSGLVTAETQRRIRKNKEDSEKNKEVEG